MSDLPKGWAVSVLGLIASWGSGGTPSRNKPNYYGGGIPWIKTGELGQRLIITTNETISQEGLNNSSAKLFPAGSVAMAMYGATIGKTSILGIEATTNQACAVGIPNKKLTSKEYLYYYLCSQKDAFVEAGKGGAQPNISQSTIKEWEVPLPPLNEQKRIADKLDTLLARVDACRERLDRIPAILKRFRQAVLAAATSGRLTEEWRIENDPKENAETALATIESKRKGHLRVQKSEATLDSLDLFDLPYSWSWIKNYRLAVDSVNAICAGPFGTIFKAKDFRDTGIPIIFLRHVGNGKYLTNKPGFMDISVWRKLHQEYSVQGGELLVTKLGDPPGTACIYPKGIGVAMVTPDVMKMEVDDQAADPRYLMYFFNAPSCKNLVRQLAFGVTRLRIDLAMFKNFPIPLPPRIEQAEIVRRVEILFAYADRLEARYTVARAQVEKLTPALLAKAFRGELVSQDPNDEPASVLLERIRAAAPAPTKRNSSKAVNSATGS